MTVSKILAGSALMLAAGSVLAAPSDLADLKDDSGNQLFSQVPNNAYLETGGAYVNLTDRTGNQDDSTAVLLAEAAGLAGGNSFGIFDQNSGNELEVFAGSVSPTTTANILFDITTGQATNQTTGASATIGTTFGFFIDNGLGNKWYSDPTMNSGFDAAGLYDTTGASGQGLFGSDVVVAFEDVQGGDRDFNDLVVGLDDVAVVPEPGTLALLGMGLAGLGMQRRRKA